MGFDHFSNNDMGAKYVQKHPVATIWPHKLHFFPGEHAHVAAVAVYLL